MYIHRFLEKKIEPFLDKKEALSIVGARQVGKTTFLKYLQKKYEDKGKSVVYITFERQSDLELFNQIEDFRSLHQKYDVVMIDEFQYASKGGQKLKYLYDTTKTKYIVSGSSSLELKFQTGKYMVGRMIQFELASLSFREYLSWRENELAELLDERIGNVFASRRSGIVGSVLQERLDRHFRDYLVFGGYPAVVLTEDKKEKEKILESILGNYLLREIRSLLQLATEEELMRLSKLLATQIGALVNYQELGASANLSYREVREHIKILRQTYIVDLIQPYFTNKRTELVKSPKAYFFDLGFRNFLLSDFRLLETRGDVGALVENYVFTALRKTADGFRSPHYWRTKSGAEVDFVIEEGGKVMPIEVKYSSRASIGKSMHSFLAKFSPERAFVITRNETREEKIKDTRVIFVPVSYL